MENRSNSIEEPKDKIKLVNTKHSINDSLQNKIRMSVENNSIDSVSSKNLLNIPSKSASMLETERTVFSKDTTIVAKSEHYNTDIRIPSFNKRNSASNNLHSNYLENLKWKSTKDAKKIKRNILKINEIKESNPSNSKTMKNEEFKVIINHSPSKQFEIKRKSWFNEVDTFKEFPKFKRMTTTFADMRYFY